VCGATNPGPAYREQKIEFRPKWPDAEVYSKIQFIQILRANRMDAMEEPLHTRQAGNSPKRNFPGSTTMPE
jgi:hypothetical protein